MTRCRSTQDRRVVHISLSEKGVKAYYHHKHFHEQMIQGVVEVLTEEELQALIKALTKLIPGSEVLARMNKEATSE